MPIADRALALARAADPLVLGGVLQVLGVQRSSPRVGHGRTRSCRPAGYCAVSGSANSSAARVDDALDVERLRARRPSTVGAVLLELVDRARRRSRAPPAERARLADHVDDVRRLDAARRRRRSRRRRPRTTVCATTRTSSLICIASAPAVRSSWTVSSSESMSTGPSASVDGDPDAGPGDRHRAGQDARGCRPRSRACSSAACARAGARLQLVAGAARAARSRPRRAGWCRPGR